MKIPRKTVLLFDTRRTPTKLYPRFFISLFGTWEWTIPKNFRFSIFKELFLQLLNPTFELDELCIKYYTPISFLNNAPFVKKIDDCRLCYHVEKGTRTDWNVIIYGNRVCNNCMIQYLLQTVHAHIVFGTVLINRRSGSELKAIYIEKRLFCCFAKFKNWTSLILNNVIQHITNIVVKESQIKRKQ